MKRQHSTKTLLSLMLLVASATLLLSFFGIRHMYGLNSPLRGEVERFLEVREIIAQRYVGTYEEADLTEAALMATVLALGDHWSRYMPPEVYAAHLRRIGNQQQGIGIQFVRQQETNELLIIEVTRGSPAEEAGLLPGDILVRLEGISTAGLTTEEVQQMVADRFDSYVTAELRDEAGDLRTVRVYVKEFFVNPVLYEMLEEDIGYIRIENFDRSSDTETLEAIQSLREAGARGFIFDVRNNPGGRITELINILDYLLPEGELFVYEDPDGREHVRSSGPAYLRMPMVVLVNASSFSAAEFFAAILQEKQWAQIVGVPTSGKSRSQVTIPLASGSALHLSTSRYLTPGRVDLYEAGGISPDYEVDKQEGEEDGQLEMAIAVLRRLLAMEN